MHKQRVDRLVKEFLGFYGTKSFNIVFRRAETSPYSELNEYSPQPRALFL